MKRSHVKWVLGLAIARLGGQAAHGAVIASDSFLTAATATAGAYTAGNINGQTNTGGTFGYFTGAAGGNPAPGWTSGTGAYFASVTALSHPLTVNASVSASDGSLNAAGNANNRVQYRDFTTTAPPVSSSYFYSTLIRESATSYTGTAFAGLAPSLATNGNATLQATGFAVGFVNGAMTLFYNNGGTNFTSATDQLTLIASPTAGSTYLAEVAVTVLSGTSATLTPRIYDATGALVNNPIAQTVTATLNTATDLGAFEGFVSSNINLNASGATPITILFDEFRFGTAEADVVSTPEPGTLALLGLCAGPLLSRRQRRR